MSEYRKLQDHKVVDSPLEWEIQQDTNSTFGLDTCQERKQNCGKQALTSDLFQIINESIYYILISSPPPPPALPQTEQEIYHYQLQLVYMTTGKSEFREWLLTTTVLYLLEDTCSFPIESKGGLLIKHKQVPETGPLHQGVLQPGYR